MPHTTALSFADQFAFSRASTRLVQDKLGRLSEVASGIPAIEYARDGTVNFLRNPRMEGAQIGTPGRQPNNWTLGSPNGLTQTIIATGVEGGIPYMDVRLFGSPSAASSTIWTLEAANVIDANNSEVIALSFYARLLAGTTNGLTTMSTRLAEYDGNNVALGLNQENFAFPTGAPLAVQRFVSIKKITGSATKYIRPQFLIPVGSASIGVPIDITLRIGGVQVERLKNESQGVGPLVLPPPGQNDFSSTNSRVGISVLDGTTNEFPNPRYEGATVGSPGVLPTYMLTSGPGLAIDVVSTGTEDGIPYVDLRYYGTITSTYLTMQWRGPVSGLRFAAAPNEALCCSGYWKVVAGTPPWAVSRTGLFWRQNGADGQTSDIIDQMAPPVGGRLIDGRFVSAQTMTKPDCVSISLFFQGSNMVVGAAVDVTIRLGAFQFERGSAASLLHLPPAGSPGAAVRLPDLVTGNAPNLAFRPEGSTIIASFSVSDAAFDTRGIVRVDDGTSNYWLGAHVNASRGVYMRCSYGAATLAVWLGTLPAGVTEGTIRLTWSGTRLWGVLDGEAVKVLDAGTEPVGLSTLRVGRTGLSNGLMQGRLQRLTILPRTATPEELPTITD